MKTTSIIDMTSNEKDSNDQILKEKLEERSSNYENRLLNVFHQVFRLSEVS